MRVLYFSQLSEQLRLSDQELAATTDWILCQICSSRTCFPFLAQLHPPAYLHSPPKTDRRTDGPAHMENNQYLFELKRGGKCIIVLNQLALGNSPKSMAAGFMCGEGLVDTAELNKQHRKTDTIKFIHTNTLSRHTNIPLAP